MVKVTIEGKEVNTEDVSLSEETKKIIVSIIDND